MKYITFILCLGLSCTLTACDNTQATPPPKSTTVPQKATPKPRKNLLQDAQALQAAQDALFRLPELKNHKIQVYGNVDFFNGIRPRIELSIQSPQNPKHIHSYRYENQKWQRVSTETDELEENITLAQINKQLTPLEQIQFVNAIPVAQLWQQKGKEVKAVVQEPYHVAFVWLPKLKKRFWHTPEIEALGAQYYLSVNLDGTIWEWKKL